MHGYVMVQQRCAVLEGKSWIVFLPGLALYSCTAC